MRRSIFTGICRHTLAASLVTIVGLFTLCAIVPPTANAQQKKGSPEKSSPEKMDMNQMMAMARRYTQPGPEHKALERFLGEWTTEVRAVIPGQESRAERGEESCQWLYPGRYVQCRSKGKFLGMDLDANTIIGYDNFKKSYRIVTVSSMDTAMNTSEGDLTPDGKALVTYGTLDEYLTGEHDKMVKYIWRFDSADSRRHEVHDLPIGETGTQVISIKATRKTAAK